MFNTVNYCILCHVLVWLLQLQEIEEEIQRRDEAQKEETRRRREVAKVVRHFSSSLDHLDFISFQNLVFTSDDVVIFGVCFF